MVEVENMVLSNMGAVDKIADNSAIVRHLVGNTKGAIQVQGRRNTVRLRADPTDSLRDNLGITGVSAPQD